MPREGGEPRDVTAGLDRDVLSTAWLPDGSGLLVMAPDMTRIHVWHQPLDGTAQRLNLGSVDPAVGPPGPTTDFALSDDGRILFIGMERNWPHELYLMDSLEGSPQRITDMNGALASREQGRRETIMWAGPDGFGLSGVLTYPPGYEAGRKYPLVLVIHGGPMLTSTESFNPEIQIMAGRGWLIFQPNYRGSNNQGMEFQRAVVNDAGDGPARDVMSGVELLKRRGLVDESRIAVSGWSYGGFMTAWLTAHYDGWAAAVAGAPHRLVRPVQLVRLQHMARLWLRRFALAQRQRGELLAAVTHGPRPPHPDAHAHPFHHRR
jgi:dipeptidyl aminopeptidase/acylaminoacyl peptidase